MTLGFDSSTSEFELLLVMSDLDGNLPVTPRTTFKAHFPISILAAALKRPNFRQRLDLAIEGRDSAFHGTLPLLISHRLAPGLLGRTSVDNEHPKSPLKVVEDQPKELFRIYGHVEEILHLTDLPNLPASNEIFLFFSVTSQVLVLLLSFITCYRVFHHLIHQLMSHRLEQ